MTATERARRSDALYYGGGPKRYLCDRIANVESDLEDAEAENARLRERITTQKQTIQAYRDESREWREVAERAQAENAKLRELVRKVENYERMGCNKCAYEDSCDAGTLYDEDCTMSSEIEREKRELEIGMEDK